MPRGVQSKRRSGAIPKMDVEAGVELVKRFLAETDDGTYLAHGKSMDPAKYKLKDGTSKGYKPDLPSLAAKEALLHTLIRATGHDDGACTWKDRVLGL